MNGCSVKECENGASAVYCPNRFTGDEMVGIRNALDMSEGYLEEMMEDYDKCDKWDGPDIGTMNAIMENLKKTRTKVERLLKGSGIFPRGEMEETPVSR